MPRICRPTIRSRKSPWISITRYEQTFGPGTRNGFAGYSYDGFLLLDAAVPIAAKTAKPGTPEFRPALRDALENLKNVVGTHGVYNMSAEQTTTASISARRVLVHVENGEWQLLK